MVHPLHLLPASSLKLDDEPAMPIIMSAACHHGLYLNFVICTDLNVY